MLRGLLHEIVRRRLWPIPVVALLVAVGAPLLFLKSSPGPSLTAQGSQAVDASTAGGLPVGARRLLRTKTAAKRHKARAAADPFDAPSSAGSGKLGATAASRGVDSPAPSSASTAKQEPVPVVITGADGKTTPNTTGEQSSANTGASNSGHIAVDVRFGPKGKGRTRHSVPRLTPLAAKGRIVATFVMYSPTRNKAVFAISPDTRVTGSAECRREAGICRYVDVSRGTHVTLTIFGPGRSLLTRQLSVQRMRSMSGAEPRPPLAGRCLLSKLLELAPGDPTVASHACD